MAKEKRLNRITMYIKPSDPEDETSVRIIGRIEIDGEARLLDDEDLGDWVNKAKNFAEDENPPAVVINMIKARLGIN